MNEFNGILEQVPETGLIPELDAIIDSEVLQLNSVNTAVQTKRWVASFKNYIKSVNGKEEIESLSDYELNEYLKKYYFQLWTNEGGFDSQSSLLCTRASIFRYHKDAPYCRVCDEKQFNSSTKVLKLMVLNWVQNKKEAENYNANSMMNME